MKIFFEASPSATAQKAFRELSKRYGQAKSARSTDVIVALGGDGQTLRALQDGIHHKKPVFGLNFGRVGFLQNLHREDIDLRDRIKTAEPLELSPLKVVAVFANGDIKTDFAVNEVHICNHNRTEGIYLTVRVDGKERVPRLGADGLIISTTVGSSGYNKSARGPVLPLGDDIIALTPNNAFMPDRMRSSVIRPKDIEIEVLDPRHRKADLYADSHAIGRTCLTLKVTLDHKNAYTLLFDPGYKLEEKVMRSQFSSPQPQ